MLHKIKFSSQLPKIIKKQHFKKRFELVISKLDICGTQKCFKKQCYVIKIVDEEN
jgi:hypothetical protein